MPDKTALLRLQDDNRGLALGIVVFIAMLVIGALLYMVMSTAMNPIAAFAMEGAGPGATQQIQLAQQIWGALLYAVVFIASLFLIARAVNEGSV